MKIIVNGALGHMGEILIKKIEESRDIQVLALVDEGSRSSYSSEKNLYEKLSFIPDDLIESSKEDELCIIDFSNAAATEELTAYAVSKAIPLLIATTGQNDLQKEMIKEASNHIPVFYSGNMSIGIALMVDLVRQTVSIFGDSDVEIIETHHTRKVDAPSGTALILAEAAKDARSELTVNMGRNGMCKRDKNEIGISSVRRGNIVGIHEVIISTESESITLKHEAHDRGLFADGALTASRFLIEQEPGLYDMKSIFDN